MLPGKKNTTNTYKENQYRVNVFVEGREFPLLYRKVELDKPGQMQRFAHMLNVKFPLWTTINVYGGVTRAFKHQIRKDGYGFPYIHIGKKK
jgi:hypothetical protein